MLVTPAKAVTLASTTSPPISLRFAFTPSYRLIMAKIKEMLGEKVISGFRHKLDFYYYMGIPCARRWPKSPGKRRSPAVMAGWAPFAYAAGEWNNLSPEVRRAYEELATGSGLSGRDMFTRSYMKGLFRNPIP